MSDTCPVCRWPLACHASPCAPDAVVVRIMKANGGARDVPIDCAQCQAPLRWHVRVETADRPGCAIDYSAWAYWAKHGRLCRVAASETPDLSSLRYNNQEGA